MAVPKLFTSSTPKLSSGSLKTRLVLEPNRARNRAADVDHVKAHELVRAGLVLSPRRIHVGRASRSCPGFALLRSVISSTPKTQSSPGATVKLLFLVREGQTHLGVALCAFGNVPRPAPVVSAGTSCKLFEALRCLHPAQRRGLRPGRSSRVQPARSRLLCAFRPSVSGRVGLEPGPGTGLYFEGVGLEFAQHLVSATSCPP